MTKLAPVPDEEAARLAALREAAVLDTGAEAPFDDIARLAAQVCRTPVALISLVDEGRQWFKARVGFEPEELPREWAFCAHAICGPGVFVIPDAAADERFAANPLVISDPPHLRFYAGAPLLTEDGHALGTLCVIDREPRELSDEQRDALRVLAHHASALIELRRRALALDEANRDLRREAAERAAAERAREDLREREANERAAAEESERHYRFLAEAIPQHIWTATPDGALDYVNRRASDYFGHEAGLLGWGWQDVVHPDDLPDALERWRRSLSTGETYEIEFRLRGAAGGQYRWHLGRAVPLLDSEGRILRWFGTNTDIDDQRRLYRLAQEANRTKDEFLATLSHELRTPLTSIMGWAEMLSLGMLDEDARRHAVEVIEKSARAQAQLIADLLDVSRISVGRLRLDVRPVELRQVTEAAIEVVRLAAEAKGIRLRVEDCGLRIEGKDDSPASSASPKRRTAKKKRTNDVDDADESAIRNPQSAIVVMGDPNRLQQVIWNLLSNAVKFTPEGGSVTVRLARTAGGQAEIAVTDTGAGIRPAFLPYVFDRFRQAEDHMTRAHGGLGIGLSIVRHLVELHGGTVRAESAGEGRGATFRVRLPLRSARKAGDAGKSDPGARHPARKPTAPPDASN